MDKDIVECLDCKDKIIKELYKTIEILGGMSDILSIIGSYNDTQIIVGSKGA